MSSALVVMDVQHGVVDRFGVDDEWLTRTATAISAARQHSVPVIFVRIAFRRGFPEISPLNERFFELARNSGDAFEENNPATQVHAALGARAEDPVVVKKRVGSFHGSDFEVLLRSMQVSGLVLCGVSTGGAVLTTVREAADRDYQLTVLGDVCWDSDDEVHRVLLEKIFPRQAQVVTVDEWVKSLG